MVWTSFENGIFNSEGFINEGAALDSVFMTKLVDNLLASGVSNVEEVGDVIYAGEGTTSSSKNIKRLSVSEGVLQDLFSVGSDNIPVWQSGGVELDYYNYITNPSLYNSVVSDSSLVTKSSGTAFIEAHQLRVPSDLVVGKITGSTMLVSTIGELDEFQPKVEMYVPGSHSISTVLHTDSTKLSVREHDDGYWVWSFSDVSIVYRVGFVFVGKTTGVSERYILDIMDGDRVPDFDVLPTNGVEYKIDAESWFLTKNSLESSVASDTIKYISYSSRPSLSSVSGFLGTLSTTTAIALSWNVVFDAESYTIQHRAGSADFSNVSGSPTVNTSITVSSVDADTLHYFRIRATSTNYFDGPWETIDVSTVLSSLSRVDNVRISDIEEDSFSVNWNRVNNATDYSLEVRKIGSTYGDSSSYDSRGSDTTRSVSGREAATVYYVRIKASADLYTDSAYSFEVSVTTLSGRLNTPDAPSLTVVSGAGIRVSWNSVENATSYFIYGSLEASNRSTTGTSYTYFGLTAGDVYEFRIEARPSSSLYANSAISSSSSITILGLSLSAPSTFLMSQSGYGIVISWNRVSNAQSYTHQWRSSTASYSSSTRIGSTTSLTTVLSAFVHSGVVYYARVKATASGYPDSGWIQQSIVGVTPS